MKNGIQKIIGSFNNGMLFFIFEEKRGENKKGCDVFAIKRKL